MQTKSILLSGRNNNDWLEASEPKRKLHQAAVGVLHKFYWQFSLGVTRTAHSFRMNNQRLLALQLIHLLVVFCVSAAAAEVQ